MKIELTLTQLRALLFPSLTTDMDAARAAMVREVLDWQDPIAIPAWLHVAIQDAENARVEEARRLYPNDEFTPVFHVQQSGPHRFLWPSEVWRRSRDFRIATITRHRAAIAIDSAAIAADRARTAHEAKVYDWVTKLATRIVHEFYPHMKVGFLRQTFQSLIVKVGFDLTKFKAALEESFDDEVIKVCWVNQPEVSQPDASNETDTSPEENPRVQENREAPTQAAGQGTERTEQGEHAD